ncbi:hypothetical protein TrRE_jg1608, partial [Triparma retinervis]
LDHARTEHVFLLDVDFAVSDEGSEKISTMAQSLDAKTALVVPAFEVDMGRVAYGREHFLKGKGNLKSKAVSGFHVGHFPKGHRATDFDRFFATSDGGCYEIQYEDCFEPYIVAKREGLERYDERFRGYGLNKVSHLMACSKSFNFLCASNAYVLAPEMKKSDSWDKMYNKRFKDPLLAVKVQVLFDRFRAELLGRRKRKEGVEAMRREGEKEGGVAGVYAADIG